MRAKFNPRSTRRCLLLLLVAGVSFGCAVQKNNVASSAGEVVEDGFVDDDTLIIPGSGLSPEQFKDRSRKEKAAQEAARMDAQLRLRQYCPIGLTSWESRPCPDGSLHTPEIKARMDAAQKQVELTKISCKDEADGAVSCRGYYRFKIPGIKPLCDRAQMQAQALCM